MFWISQDRYIAEAGATRVLVTVEFIPGNRGYSGWVDFSTCGGTAAPDQDYVPAMGRLWFDGPGARQFEVKLNAALASDHEKIIEVCLENPDAVLDRDRAEIVILPAPPKLTLTPAGNGIILVSWPAGPGDFRLESAVEPAGPWSDVTEPISLENDSWVLRQPMAGMARFFRLRHWKTE